MYLDGLFGHGYRNLKPAILGRVGLKKLWRAPGEGRQSRGEWRIGAYRESSMSNRMAPVLAPGISSLQNRCLHDTK